jgi:2-polyprenyl-3-methyl-5-hydroxy-6-metoxy-1,4-benzoquinol methylase
MAAMPADRDVCWVCGGAGLVLRKRSDVASVTAADFAISDSHYGRTAAIYQCPACGFLQCSDIGDVAAYYRELEDAAYEASRPERCLQARRLLRRLCAALGRDLQGQRLLDVGAGSGPLVEEARALGADCEGVEPSEWLCARAAEHGLDIHHGVLPHPDIRGEFDLVTLVDVIEHVPDPIRLLREVATAARPGGVVVLVTPDVGSVAARLMGWRWWHFRLAHVGYFSAGTIERLCDRAGLQPFHRQRPGWVLPLSYLAERAGRYVPFGAGASPARWMRSVTVPFNLFDSIMLCARRGPAPVGPDRGPETP